MPQLYQQAFLRRYVFLLSLGRALSQFGFEPCHAAAITASQDNQKAALIIGASGAGKTTLSIDCALSGYGLLGDDLVMLYRQAEDEAIGAYAITHEVSVRSSSVELWDNLAFLHDYAVDQRDKRYCSIEQIRSGAARLQAPIRLLLFPSLTTGTASRATRLSKAGTLKALIDLCMSRVHGDAQSQEKLFVLLCSLAEQAPGYRLAIARNAHDGAQLIQSLFAGGIHD